ncbi:hypothetical protein BDY17DRAFT_30530 [Neohortaea acidophila]|uniref:Uncharacterized protein n=1 Tax=Neohortaea acidophila TaxID=245834 RepID=A0A6A6PK40_9PEZI|nr:uncharacterized protein BDY17DRAFT_30530 [Neohortaea acidophila]KAF2480034.1 hypothetical protein BDY17DRAFT_30530 [Neohortaea acidophila]
MCRPVMVTGICGQVCLSLRQVVWEVDHCPHRTGIQPLQNLPCSQLVETAVNIDVDLCCCDLCCSKMYQILYGSCHVCMLRKQLLTKAEGTGQRDTIFWAERANDEACIELEKHLHCHSRRARWLAGLQGIRLVTSGSQSYPPEDLATRLCRRIYTRWYNQRLHELP